MAVLVVFGDDLLALTTTSEMMASLVEELLIGSRFKVKDLSEASHYMECHITRNREKRKLEFSQHLYLRTIVDGFGIDKTAMVPAIATVDGGWAGDLKGREGDAEYSLSQSSSGHHVGCDQLKRSPYGRKVLRESG